MADKSAKPSLGLPVVNDCNGREADTFQIDCLTALLPGAEACYLTLNVRSNLG